LDDYSEKILFALMTTKEILKKSIYHIENIEFQRKAFPKFDVIYFVAPTIKNFRQIAQDFSTNSKNGSLYRKIFLYLTNVCSTESFTYLSRKSTILTNLISMKEANLDFFPLDDCTFTLHMPQALFTLYQPSQHQTQKNARLSEIAEKLSTVITNLGQNPDIEIIYHKDACQNAFYVANKVSIRLGHLLNSKHANLVNLEKSLQKIKVVVLDRSYDMNTPFLHDVHYQSMAQDLVGVGGDLGCDESDELWVCLRYMHIADVLKYTKKFQDWIGQNEIVKMGASVADKKPLGIDKLQEFLVKHPKFEKNKERLGVHLTLIEKCWNLLKHEASNPSDRENLEELIELELSLCTGVDSEGTRCHSAEIFDDFICP
jgi:hypothetical protein